MGTYALLVVHTYFDQSLLVVLVYYTSIACGLRILVLQHLIAVYLAK